MPAAPGTEEEPPPAAARGDFTTDVLDFLRAAYSTEIEPLKPVNVNSHGRKGVNYKGTTLDLGDKQVKVYFHGEKTDPAQIALIFEGSKAALKSISSQIDYSLNSLVLGPKATSYYNGQDEFSAGEEGPSAPPVF